MTRERLALGEWGEELACRHLQGLGMKVLRRNYRTPVGEIDIVARYRQLLIFIEVKTRRGSGFGAPQEAVGTHKQRQIIRAAQWYLQREKIDSLQPRFDVVAVLCQSDGQVDIQHLPNAFELAN